MKQLLRMKKIWDGMDRLRYEVKSEAQYEVNTNTYGTYMDVR